VVDWSSYNNAPVRRGELVLDFDVIDNWKNELKKMNHGNGVQHMFIIILL